MTLGTDSVRLWEPLKLEEAVTMVIRLGEPVTLGTDSVRLWEPLKLEEAIILVIRQGGTHGIGN